MKYCSRKMVGFLRRRAIYAILPFLAWFSLAPLPALAGQDSSSCSSNAASRQFDFWLGEWNVTYPGAPSASSSTVSLELGKCLVMENWSGGKGHEGMNVFAHGADDKHWHGLFADNEGRVRVFEEKVADGSAEFLGPSRDAEGKTELNRIRVKRLSANRVEQIWEKSADTGASCKIVFRGEYSRKGTGPAAENPGR